MTATINSKPKLPGFITLLLVIALGISLAKLMWLVITPAQKLTLSSQNNKVASVNQKTITNYGKLIADQHIFGKVAVKKTPVKQSIAATKEVKPVTPKVKLNAKLFGIVAYSSQVGGYALISNKGGPQKAYGKGESLQEGVTIYNILPDKVIVDNNGVKEELLLPVKIASNKSNNSRSSIPLSGSRPSVNASLPSGLSTKAENGNAPDLSQLKQDVLANPNKLAEIVRPSPAIVNGEFKGFRIRSGKNRKLFKQLNFRNNDIITEVNGIVLDSPNKGIDVFGQLESATSLSIKVLRGNQEVYIDHSF